MNYNESNRFTGDKIRSYRTKKKLTQGELAGKVGLKGNSISAYERGGVEIPHSKLLMIAEVLEVNYLDLLPITGTDDNDTISEYIQEAKSKLDNDQMDFLEQLIAKTLSLDESERADFLKNIRFAVEFFDKK